MLYQVISHDYTFVELMILFLGYAAFILVMGPVHEFAHAFTAYRMGDPTARYNGRLTLNPLAHIDPIGAAMIFIFGVGYAKAVPINPYNFRNRRAGIALTSLAGPVSNLLMAAFFMGLLRILWVVDGGFALGLSFTKWFSYVFLVLYVVFVRTNIALAVFNLLPIPPLDGYRIASTVLPARWTYWVDRNYWYIMGILMLLLFSGLLSEPIRWLANLLEQGYWTLFGFPTIQ